MPKAGEAQLRIFNGVNCPVDVSSALATINGRIEALSALQVVDIPLTDSAEFELRFKVDQGCSEFPGQTLTAKVTLQEAQVYLQLFL